VEYAENIGVVDGFLERHVDMEKIPLPHLKGNLKLDIKENTLQVLPQHFESDGFFVAAFRKK